MLRDLLTRVQSAVVRRPRRVVVLFLALTVLAIISGLQVEFRSSRSELAPPDDPDQLRMNELLAENAGTEALIACAEPDGEEPPKVSEIQDFVDRLAREFAADERVEHVFHRIDVDWFLERGLYLLPTETLQRVVAAAEAQRGLLAALPGVSDLAAFNDLIADQIEQGRVSGSLSDFDENQAVGALAVVFIMKHMCVDWCLQVL